MFALRLQLPRSLQRLVPVRQLICSSCRRLRPRIAASTDGAQLANRVDELAAKTPQSRCSNGTLTALGQAPVQHQHGSTTGHLLLVLLASEFAALPARAAASAEPPLVELDVTAHLLTHPAAAAVLGAAALWSIPRAAKAGAQVVGVPVAMLLVAYLLTAHPSATCGAFLATLAWAQGHPEVTSAVILSLTAMLLLPSLLLGAGTLVVALVLVQVVAYDVPPLPSSWEEVKKVLQRQQDHARQLASGGAAVPSLMATTKAGPELPPSIWLPVPEELAGFSPEQLGDELVQRLPQVALIVPRPQLPSLPLLPELGALPLPSLPDLGLPNLLDVGAGMLLPQLGALPLPSLPDLSELPTLPELSGMQLPDLGAVKLPPLPHLGVGQLPAVPSGALDKVRALLPVQAPSLPLTLPQGLHLPSFPALSDLDGLRAQLGSSSADAAGKGQGAGAPPPAPPAAADPQATSLQTPGLDGDSVLPALLAPLGREEPPVLLPSPPPPGNPLEQSAPPAAAVADVPTPAPAAPAAALPVQAATAPAAVDAAGSKSSHPGAPSPAPALPSEGHVPPTPALTQAQPPVGGLPAAEVQLKAAPAVAAKARVPLEEAEEGQGGADDVLERLLEQLEHSTAVLSDPGAH